MTTDPLLESGTRDRVRPTVADLAARLTSTGFGAGWSTLKSVPPPVADRLFRAAADLAVRRRGSGVVQYARNMLRVLGDQATPASLAAVTRAGVRSYARYWRETFQLPGRDLDTLGLDLAAHSTLGLEHLDRAQEQGRGTILALPHCGNWDVAGLMIAKRYGRLTVIVERLEPESLYAKFAAFRELLGMEVVPLTGPQVDGRASAPDANPSKLLRERLEAGGVIALLADRDLSSSGIPVTFFGEPTRMPAGPGDARGRHRGRPVPHPSALHGRRLEARHPGADGAARHAAGAAGPAGHAADGGGLRGRHRRPSRRLAHDAAALARRPARGARRAGRRAAGAHPGGAVRVGLVCPYSFDIPGGVQAHVADLARTLIGLGHHVSVLAPGGDEGAQEVPEYVVRSGRSVPIPYNGSIARLSFGPMSYTRVRRWIRAGRFDVLHVHEPVAPSLSMLALMVADGPIVATFHTANPRSRMLAAFQGVLQPFLEKITGRIAVSELARQVQVEHLGGDAVIIPNGVDVRFFAGASPLRGYPRPGGTVGFIGRFDEPRKGMEVLLDALRPIAAERPDLQLLVAGSGDEKDLREEAGPRLQRTLRFLGRVSDEDKAAMLRSVDVYCAPNTGGESFGIILTEAMSAGTPVVASDLDAFRRVLDGGIAGVLSPVGDAPALGRALTQVLDDPGRRAVLAAQGRRVVAAYDWPVVAATVVKVYETVVAADPRLVAEAD